MKCYKKNCADISTHYAKGMMVHNTGVIVKIKDKVKN